MGGNLDLGMRCIKYMMVVTNCMFVIIGFLLVSVGSTIYYIYRDFDAFMEDHYFSPAALFVAIGIIMFFVALFGCVGGIRESTMLVNLYAFFLFIILILEIAAVIAAYSMRNNIRYHATNRMLETMDLYETNDHARDSWDFLQSSLQCCGIETSEEWNQRNLTETPPASCMNSNNDIFQPGCLDRLYYIISECALLIGTGGILVAVVQTLGIIFARMLAKSIRHTKTEREVKRQQSRQRLYAQMARQHDEKPTPVLYSNSKA